MKVNISGYDYQLAAGERIDRQPILEFPAQYRTTGQQRREDRSLISSWWQEDFSAGFGCNKIVSMSSDRQMASFWDSEVDTINPGQVVLPAQRLQATYDINATNWGGIGASNYFPIDYVFEYHGTIYSYKYTTSDSLMAYLDVDASANANWKYFYHGTHGNISSFYLSRNMVRINGDPCFVRGCITEDTKRHIDNIKLVPTPVGWYGRTGDVSSEPAGWWGVGIFGAMKNKSEIWWTAIKPNEPHWVENEALLLHRLNDCGTYNYKYLTATPLALFPFTDRDGFESMFAAYNNRLSCFESSGELGSYYIPKEVTYLDFSGQGTDYNALATREFDSAIQFVMDEAIISYYRDGTVTEISMNLFSGMPTDKKGNVSFLLPTLERLFAKVNTKIIPNEWVIPSSHDNVGSWIHPEYAHDGSINPPAFSNLLGTWVGSLVLNLTEERYCNKIRFWSDSIMGTNIINIDVHNKAGTWYDLYDGTIAETQWVEKDLGTIAGWIDSARINMWTTWGACLNEFQLYENYRIGLPCPIFQYDTTAWHYFGQAPIGSLKTEMFLGNVVPSNSILSIPALHLVSLNPATFYHYYWLYPLNNPLTTPDYRFEATGHLTLPQFDGGIPNERGNMFKQTIDLDQYPGTSYGVGYIEAKYGIDGATLGTSAGVASVIGLNRLSLGGTTGAVGLRYQPRFEFHRAATAFSSPVMYSGVMEYLKFPDLREAFKMKLDLTRTAMSGTIAIATLASNLYNLRDNKELVNMYYYEGTIKSDIFHVKMISTDATELTPEDANSYYKYQRQLIVNIAFAEIAG